MGPTSLRQRAAAGGDGVLAEHLFDAEELIVFHRAIGAAKRTGLDPPVVRGLREVGEVLFSPLTVESTGETQRVSVAA